MVLLTRRIGAALTALAVVVPTAAACSTSASDRGAIIIGAAAFSQTRPSAFGWALPWSWSEASGYSEGQVLAELYAAALRKAGYHTKIKTMRSPSLIGALEAEQIHLIPSYAAS